MTPTPRRSSTDRLDESLQLDRQRYEIEVRLMAAVERIAELMEPQVITSDEPPVDLDRQETINRAVQTDLSAHGRVLDGILRYLGLDGHGNPTGAGRGAGTQDISADVEIVRQLGEVRQLIIAADEHTNGKLDTLREMIATLTGDVEKVAHNVLVGGGNVKLQWPGVVSADAADAGEPLFIVTSLEGPIALECPTCGALPGDECNDDDDGARWKIVGNDQFHMKRVSYWMGCRTDVTKAAQSRDVAAAVERLEKVRGEKIITADDQKDSVLAESIQELHTLLGIVANQAAEREKTIMRRLGNIQNDLASAEEVDSPAAERLQTIEKLVRTVHNKIVVQESERLISPEEALRCLSPDDRVALNRAKRWKRELAVLREENARKTQDLKDLRYVVREALSLISKGVVAFDVTRQYVGYAALPAIAGWSWFDWVTKAQVFLANQDEDVPDITRDPSPWPAKTPVGVRAAINSPAGRAYLANLGIELPQDTSDEQTPGRTYTVAEDGALGIECRQCGAFPGYQCVLEPGSVDEISDPHPVRHRDAADRLRQEEGS